MAGKPTSFASRSCSSTSGRFSSKKLKGRWGWACCIMNLSTKLQRILQFPVFLRLTLSIGAWTKLRRQVAGLPHICHQVATASLPSGIFSARLPLTRCPSKKKSRSWVNPLTEKGKVLTVTRLQPGGNTGLVFQVYQTGHCTHHPLRNSLRSQLHSLDADLKIKNAS